jgi:hypothetical protein
VGQQLRWPFCFKLKQPHPQLLRKPASGHWSFNLARKAFVHLPIETHPEKLG